MAILAELKDPRVRDVTVTHVEVSGDMRQAKIYVSIMGDEKKQQLSLRGLQNSAGFLQAKISDRIDTRYTPKLEFVLDLGVKHSIEIARLLHDVLPPKPADAPADGDVSQAATATNANFTSREFAADDDQHDADFDDADELSANDATLQTNAETKSLNASEHRPQAAESSGFQATAPGSIT